MQSERLMRREDLLLWPSAEGPPPLAKGIVANHFHSSL